MMKLECDCDPMDVEVWVILDDRYFLWPSIACPCMTEMDYAEDVSGEEFGDLLDALKKGVKFREDWSNVDKEFVVEYLEEHQSIFGGGKTCADVYGWPKDSQLKENG